MPVENVSNHLNISSPLSNAPWEIRFRVSKMLSIDHREENEGTANVIERTGQQSVSVSDVSYCVLNMSLYSVVIA